MPRRLPSLILGLALLLALPLPAVAHDPSPASPQGTTLGDATPAASRCPAPEGFSPTGVAVGLEATVASDKVVAFGLPVPAGAVADAGTLAVTAGGVQVPAQVKVLLQDHGADGAPMGVRAVLVQLPASVLQNSCSRVDVAWRGGGVTVTTDAVPFAQTSAAFDEVVDTANYSIEERNGAAALVTTDRRPKVLFSAREPAVLATFPDGYLAATGILGHQVAASQIGPDLAGLKTISEAVIPFGLSAMGQESYPLNAAFVGDPTDPENGYEGWLYDRCATFLAFYAHTGDVRFLHEGDRLCSYYADHIALAGENRGIFTGKAEPDPKYSHLRGLVAYYALTGDEVALAAGTAIAERFLRDQEFVGPYRAGHTRSPDALWTERLLAVSLEALYYGHRLTGKAEYLAATKELVDTAYRHVTGDAAALAQINPGATQFPPQNCFVHTASQAAEGDANQPWCSGWMPALLVDPLLAYQDQTGDVRVDEIFIRLTRSLRDVGSAYFTNTNANEDDTFLHPAVPSAAPDAEDQRLLVPLYGVGIGADGRRQNFGEFDDYEHCLDATAITAAGIRALKRMGGYDQNSIGPFASEGDSFLALHEEFAFCADWTFTNDTRPHRDPATWTGPDAVAELATGLADPASFIGDNNIGNTSHQVSPARKISWWFNEALEQFTLLREAGVTIPVLHAGAIQPGTDSQRPDARGQASPTAGCEGVAAWREANVAERQATFAAYETTLPDDLATADPAVLRRLAAAVRTFAGKQAAGDPPAIARAANDAEVGRYRDLADALEALTDTIEAGDSAGIEAAVSHVGELTAAPVPEVAALEAACPEIAGMS